MKVLIVEDDKFFRTFYSSKLQEKGITVESAGDGAEGLKKVGSFMPDIILLDLVMPNLDGFGFLEARGKDPQIKKIPVLVFSTLGQEKDIGRAKELGATDYVNKSFYDFDKLLAKIESMLHN